MPVRESIVLALTLALSLAGIQTAAAAHNTTVTIITDPGQLRFDRRGEYDLVRLDGAQTTGRPGEPALPVRQLHIAIPAGHQARSITVRPVESRELDGIFRLIPGQPPHALDGRSRPTFVEPIEEIYASATPYPDELGRLVRQTDLAGQQMAVVSLSPLQHIPATGQLNLHRELEITVETVPGCVSRERYARFTDLQRRTYGDMVRRMVANPKDVRIDPPRVAASKSLPAGQFDHVIISHSDYASYFDDLVEWHNRRGLRDTVVTTGWIDANYAGDDTTRVRSFIIDAHSTWGTIYFLLGGEANIIPFCYRQYVKDGDYAETPPSDTWYADYDDDWTWEVMVGRISASYALEFNRIIGKLLTYEQHPPMDDYLLEALFVGMDYSPTMFGEDLKEEVALDVPPRFTINKVYDSHPGNHLDTALVHLNAGMHLFNHADHCNWWGMGIGVENHGWILEGADVNNLTNTGRYSNVVAEGCWPAAMPESDCMAEHFLFHNANGGGGVSFCGNTRVGWSDGTTQTMGSSAMERGWWKSLMVENLHHLGEMVAWAKYQHDQNLAPYDSIWKHCEWQFVIAGDPAMPLWTDVPDSLNVTHPGTLPGGRSSFAVHVASGGSDLDSAYICLWKSGEVYLTGHTDAGGDIVFMPAPATAGSLHVTVTKHNYLPYQGSSQVTGSAPPPVDDLSIELSEDDLVLAWTSPEAKTVVRYVIYRSAEGDFVPCEDDSIAGTAGTAYTDAGAAGGSSSGYFYAVRAVSDSGGKSEPSNCVGEFDVDLVSE
jgi:hypothetical protein